MYAIYFLASLWVAKLGTASPVAGSGSGSVCSKLPYDLILPFSNYPPAESFCSSHYPIPPVTITTTVTSTVTPGNDKREAKTKKTTVKTTPTTTAKTTADARSKAWAACTSQLALSGVLSTACSCIETTPTTTVTATATTTATCNYPYPDCTSTTMECYDIATRENKYETYCGQTISQGYTYAASPGQYPAADVATSFAACANAFFNSDDGYVVYANFDPANTPSCVLYTAGDYESDDNTFTPGTGTGSIALLGGEYEGGTSGVS